MTAKPVYSFVPWVRLGVANSITSADLDPQVTLRATIPVDLTLGLEEADGDAATQLVHKDVQLYGPADIVGIDAKAIVRTEPRHWITNYEPNMLAHVELYDEDFPWRYTPAAATGTRLRPWITLVVLAEDEVLDAPHDPKRPLPSFLLAQGVAAADVFPEPSELWAWAHVHVDTELGANTSESLASTVAQNPDRACSRIVCPRRLAPDTRYHAFLVPSFEAGRLAGLGLAIPPTLMATESAWSQGQAEFPYYYRWQFRTGANGDFEYLARLLRPQPADKRVGVRDIDVLRPGSRLPPIDTPAEIGGVLKLGGALRVPVATLPAPDQLEVQKYDEWDAPYPQHPFQQALGSLLNLADDYTRQSAADASSDGDPDPVVTPPLYGRWHAIATRLLTDEDGANLPNQGNWVHELNLDPRWRVAAGLGTRVVQENQEGYMHAAWAQLGDVLQANHLVALAQLAIEAGARVYEKHVRPLDADRTMSMTAPVQKRLVRGGVTVHHAMTGSALPYAAVAPAFRRIARPRGRIARKLSLGGVASATQVVGRLDRHEVTAARPWGPLHGPVTLAKVDEWAGAPTLRTVGAVRALPTRIDFTVRKTRSRTTPRGPSRSNTSPFLKALESSYALIGDAEIATPLSSLGVGAVAQHVTDALHPDETVPARVKAGILMPAHLAAAQVNTFAPAMAYPEIGVPMYEPLSAMGAELFLPNINLIPQNSITLLETNQRFIESYMVGLNHEMVRELLWREYPTDLRGTIFQQFWDVSSVYQGNPPTESMVEKLRDIPPVHQWWKGSVLGSHNHREAQGDVSQLVLVIRGELLKRYPNAVIFAIKAEWDIGRDGQPDKTKERLVTNLEAAELDDPPKSKVRTPLFEARVRPDIFFIGFDINPLEARGAGKDEAPTQSNAGWFFVLQERPGEPRFGLDEPPPPGAEGTRRVNWNSLHWGDVGTAVGGTVRLDKTISLIPYDAQKDQDNKPDPEDAAAQWDGDTTAAELAYMLYQVPAMVAIHAWRMLP